MSGANKKSENWQGELKAVRFETSRNRSNAADASNSQPETIKDASAESADQGGSAQPPASKARGNQSGADGAQNKRANRRKNKKQKATPTLVEVPPAATPAKMRMRHWGILVTFLVLVILPLLITSYYLWNRAEDQYASTVGFTVRQENGSGATDVLGGLAAQVTGVTGGSSDTDILYEFIQSLALVQRIDEKLGLRQHYSQFREQDPVFSIDPEASLEDLVEYWQRVVRISYDQNSGLIELRILAYNPEFAQTVANEILLQSQELINDLNRQAREDTLRYSQEDLEAALERLRQARSELIRFRARTQLVDPESDLQGRMGVVNMLQAQLAEALIEFDLLTQSTNANDPRIVQARRKIEVIRERIAEERRNVALGEDAEGTTTGDYPTILAEYEGLLVDREFAEQSYTAALTALDIARADAARQSRYLATYIEPTLPQTSEFPQRLTLFGLVALFLCLSWAILALIYYSIRDSR